jgi:hypothetical protein
MISDLESNDTEEVKLTNRQRHEFEGLKRTLTHVRSGPPLITRDIAAAITALNTYITNVDKLIPVMPHVANDDSSTARSTSTPTPTVSSGSASTPASSTDSKKKPKGRNKGKKPTDTNSTAPTVAASSTPSLTVTSSSATPMSLVDESRLDYAICVLFVYAQQRSVTGGSTPPPGGISPSIQQLHKLGVLPLVSRWVFTDIKYRRHLALQASSVPKYGVVTGLQHAAMQLTHVLLADASPKDHSLAAAIQEEYIEAVLSDLANGSGASVISTPSTSSSSSSLSSMITTSSPPLMGSCDACHKAVEASRKCARCKQVLYCNRVSHCFNTLSFVIAHATLMRYCAMIIGLSNRSMAKS